LWEAADKYLPEGHRRPSSRGLDSKPQTLAFALADSPVGLASWIVEKFRSWSDCDGDVLSVFPPEVLIDNLMIYWTTNTIGSSVRYYYEATHLRPKLLAGDFVRPPTAVAMWPKDKRSILFAFD
jgi:hypothetical protein